jgi:hypothetical protein
VYITYALEAGFFLRRAYRQDYETLFHAVILSKHHHYHQVYKDIIGDGNDCVIKAMVLCGGRGMGHFANGFKVC